MKRQLNKPNSLEVTATRFAPMVEKAQAELWGGPPYPARTMIEVKRLYNDDIAEIDSIFYAPVKK